MPAFLLSLLPALRKHWKLLAGAAAILAVFFAGWYVNGVRWENRMMDAREKRTQAVLDAVQEARDEMVDRFKLQVALRDRHADVLTADLAAIREENTALAAEIESAGLIKPELITCDITGDKIDEPPNPFSDNFVDLWNDAGRVRDD